MSNDHISRREFIGQASCAGVSTASLFSTLLTLRLANSLSAQTAPAGDYKALVCLFLAGGNDSFNMLVPHTAAEHAAYTTTRRNLALARDTLLQITPSNLGGRTLGIHPSMPEVRDLFTSGKLSFVSNVGSLVRPTTKADYTAGRYRPVSLFSHADQIKQWQTCIPDSRTAIGWGGRAADIIKSLNTSSLVSMNISLAGQNTFLTGQQAFGYSVNSAGATPLTGYDPLATNNLNALRTAAVNSTLEANYRNLFEKAYGDTSSAAIDSYYDFAAALQGVTIATPVPAANSLASSLGQIARTASSAGRLGARRQVFFVQIGGWDHHDEVINNQLAMLGTVSKALKFFWDALGEFGLQDKVTLFSASDFGRTLSSNGNGSDHAWGGNHVVLGGSVAGGRVAGNREQGYYPDFNTISTIDTGQGRLIPGTAVDEYAYDLLKWFGISDSDMDYVLPAYSSRFAGREKLGLIRSDTTTPPPTGGGGTTPPPAGGGDSGGGSGGGGGAISPITLAAGAGLFALKKLSDRKKRAQAAEAQTPATPPAAS